MIKLFALVYLLTKENWDQWIIEPYFTLAEFRCRDPRTQTMNQIIVFNQEIIPRIRKTRTLYKHPIKINSFYRTALWNKEEGGEGTSYHLTGSAIDFALPKDKELRARLISICRLVFPYTYVDEGKNYIHCDVRKNISYIEKEPSMLDPILEGK